VSFDRSSPSIDPGNALGLPRGDLHELVVDAAKKRPALLLETVFISVSGSRGDQIAMLRAGQADGKVAVEQQREMWLDVITKDAMHGQDDLAPELTAPALVGFRRIGEAVTEDVVTRCQSGQNQLLQVLGAGGKHQCHLRARTEPVRAGIEQHVADGLADGGAAGFARQQYFQVE